jgi:hypothetical protein
VRKSFNPYTTKEGQKVDAHFEWWWIEMVLEWMYKLVNRSEK